MGKLETGVGVYNHWEETWTTYLDLARYWSLHHRNQKTKKKLIVAAQPRVLGSLVLGQDRARQASQMACGHGEHPGKVATQLGGGIAWENFGLQYIPKFTAYFSHSRRLGLYADKTGKQGVTQVN
jgi:hypothetical protein